MINKTIIIIINKTSERRAETHMEEVMIISYSKTKPKLIKSVTIRRT